MRHRSRLNRAVLGLVGCIAVFIFTLPIALAASVPGPGESIDQLYEKVKKEGGRLTIYAALSARSMEIILPAFLKRFPAVTLEHIDATADQLLARISAEGRGGRVIGDVFGGALPYMAQIADQKLLAPLALAEAATYPAQMKSDVWVATDTQFYIAGWNTNLVKKGEEPKNFEDLAQVKWKNSLMGEPRDFQMLVGLAKRKYGSDDKAIELLKKIAENQVEFHKGHSQLVEFLVAGQRPVCFTCYAHHFPPRMKKGAPIQSLLSEGIGEIGGAVSVLKGAPHPNAALLWARWAVSEEGQRAYALAGETPAHPNVEPLEKVRPAAAYMLTIDDVREFPRYEKLWKEIFQLR
jgi:iron(III) transport system substrate-binding protein